MTAFDGLGTFTFGASAGYDIDGQIAGGRFSTTDGATLIYSFHEVGYTPDGNQFTLDDSGGGTLNVSADDGDSLTHSLTNTLIGSDSYGLTQVLVRSDAVGGSYTSAESDTDAVSGSDGFTMTATQTETVDGSGSIASGSDTYTYDETGNDTSSLSDQGSEGITGVGGVGEGATSTATGSGTAGHTLSATGSDTMGGGGFLPQGTRTYTWGQSESESTTGAETQAEGVTLGGDGESDWSTSGETASDSASDGQTGTETFSSSEGPSFSWREEFTYDEDSQDQGWDQGGATAGESDFNPDGGDAGRDGSTSSTTYTGDGQGGADLVLIETGSQVLADGLIAGGAASFSWLLIGGENDTQIETGTESSSGTDSGSEVEGGDSRSDLEVASGGGATTATTTEEPRPFSTDFLGQLSLGSFGLVQGGSESVSLS